MQLLEAYKWHTMPIINHRLPADGNPKDGCICTVSINEIDVIKSYDFKNNILIVLTGDYELVDENLLKINGIKRIFSQNVNYNYKNVNLLPFGIFNNVDYIKDIYCNKKYQNKELFAYANFDVYTNYNVRKQSELFIKRNGFLYEEPFENDNIKYFEKVGKSNFLFCPAGGGIDSYRIWECYYLNTIPILVDSPFSRHVDKLFGAYIVNSFKDIDKNHMNKYLHKYKPKNRELLNRNNFEKYILGEIKLND